MRTRSAYERLLHTLGYEFFALLITIPGAAWITGQPITGMGITAVVLSLLAMVWNLLFNMGFDHFFPPGVPRAAGIRILHAAGFEGGFVLFAVPVTAGMLAISLTEALLLDIGFLLFYLPYTYLFNLGWDKLMALMLRDATAASR